jgi:L-ribulose-5-phosphate 3-epimerase
MAALTTMKKSIGDNIFPQGVSFEAGLKLLQRAGYDGIELWLGERPWFQMKTSDAELRTLFHKIQDAGLAVSDVANSLDWDENISARDPAKREAAFRHIVRQIEAAQIFNCDAILVVAGVVTSDIPYNEVYNRCVETLQKLGPIAAKARVKIGAENCNSEQRFLLSPREFQTFLNDVNNPWVGIHLDVGNIHDTGFAEQWIEMHGPRITRVHLKDVHKHRGRCGDESVYTNIFLGDNNWKAIRAALLKVGYNGWLIAEMEAHYRYAPHQQIFDTCAAMSRLIKGDL